MTSLAAIIVDDERLARVELLALLDELTGVTVVGEAANVTEARRLLSMKQPSIVFLDVDMPGASGMDLASTVDGSCSIIFITAHAEFAHRAFRVNAVDYLLKPINIDQLRDAVARVRDRLDTYLSKHIFVSHRRGGHMIALESIDMIRAYDHYVRLYFEGKTSVHKQSLASIHATLPASLFFLANRSTIVRIASIDSIDRISRNRYLFHVANQAVEVSERASVLWRQRFAVSSGKVQGDRPS